MQHPILHIDQSDMMKAYALQYRDELLHNIIPFWEQHSIDKEHGGYHTCLKRNGGVYDTDKFLDLQAQQVLTFSRLYNEVEPRELWKEMAIHGAQFLQQYGRDADGNWYFSVTSDGKPLSLPNNMYTDCFAAMAFGALYKFTGREDHKEIATKTFNNILQCKDLLQDSQQKSIPGTRPLKNLASPVFLCNLGLELEHIIGKEQADTLVNELVHELVHAYYQPDSGLVLENVSPEGRFVNCFEGRVLNPGLAMEALWLILHLAHRHNQPTLTALVNKIMLETLERSWDNQYGGIFCFLDVKNYPPQQLEWDQKLWWVHLVTLMGLSAAWKMTGDTKCLEWFEKVHAYTWHHFKDDQYKEWYGYLNRQGEVLINSKGGKWKGCFHLPRGLYQVWKTLE